MKHFKNISLWMVLFCAALVLSCQKEDHQNENPPQEEESDMAIAFSTRGGVSSEIASAVLSNVRLFTSQQSTDKMDAELYNITRDVENSKLNAKVKTGDWDVTLVSALGDFSVETFYTSQTASAQTMFRYSPAEIIGMGHESAPQLFTGYETNVATIMADQTESITSEMARNVSKVQVIVKNIVGNIDFQSGEHEVRLHHVPSRIAYDGCLLPNATTPDTLAGHIYRSLPLFASPDEHGDLADTLDFIIPAHRGDFSSDESKHNSHKMKISVRMKCLDGSFYESEADIPLEARCNEILRLNLTISSALEIEAGIHPWIESEHDLELVQTAFTVSKSTVRMQTADEIWASSNDPITLDASGKASWLSVGFNSDNTHFTLSASFSDYTAPRSTSFTLKSGRLEKRITVEQLLPSGDFTSIWRTTTPNETVTLPLHPDGEYDCWVDWGDGSEKTKLDISAYNNTQAQHKYVEPGEHEVKISGKFKGFRFSSNINVNQEVYRYAQQMKEITNWGSCEFLDVENQFNQTAIERMETADKPNLAQVSTMESWFCRTPAFTGEGIEDWDVSQVKNMERMFSEATAFNADLSRWNVGQVTTMQRMFYRAYAFNNGGVDLEWGSKTSRVTDMESMFYQATAFNQDISSWDVSSVENMHQMFYDNPAFNNGGVALDWGETTKKVGTMYQMFYQATAFNQDVSSWDVSGVTTMNQMFRSATAFNNGGVALDWGETTAAVEDMNQMFYLATAFNQDVSSWDVSGAKNMEDMFARAYAFNNGDIGNNSAKPLSWGKTTTEQGNMKGMFYRAYAFNQDISSWDVSGVETMEGMFNEATAFNNGGVALDWGETTSNVATMNVMFASASSFNQDVSSWDVSAVTTMYRMFNYAQAFNNGGVALGWGETTSNVEYMNEMFHEARAFNQDIRSWDVSGVTTMNQMFRNASSFNQDVSSWNVSSVSDMSSMFRSALSFNQDVSDWDVSAVMYMGGMFDSASAFNNGDSGDNSAKPLSWGNNTSKVETMEGMFGYASSFNQDVSDWDVSEVIAMNGMFNYAQAFNNGGVELDWGERTAKVDNMASMFYEARAFNQDVSSWNVSSVKYMNDMFRLASAFNNGGVELDWGENTAKVENMTQMFRNAASFNQDVSSWNVSAVTSMSQMFRSATAFNNGNVALDWVNSTSSVTHMGGMFDGASSFNQDVSSWDVSAVQYMNGMFASASSFNQDVSDWDVSAVTTMESMFSSATAFNQDVSDWDVSSVDNMQYMFYQAYEFNNGDSGNNGAKPLSWGNNTAQVGTMYQMFNRAFAFNQDVSSWDVSAVDNMYRMFKEATSFNNGDSGNNSAKPLNWGNNTAQVGTMYQMFDLAYAFNQDVSSWDVSAVTTMQEMFAQATAFNNGGTALNWGSNTNKVGTMYRMFYQAAAFNQDVSSWNVNSVTTMQEMFYGASIFNQDISGWNVSNLYNMQRMFYNAAAFNQNLSGWDVSNMLYWQDYDNGANAWNDAWKPPFP
ncbi:MAG: BspA family leucine-rich repeat surface protein [Mangrovibacterium sp.]